MAKKLNASQMPILGGEVANWTHALDPQQYDLIYIASRERNYDHVTALGESMGYYAPKTEIFSHHDPRHQAKYLKTYARILNDSSKRVLTIVDVPARIQWEFTPQTTIDYMRNTVAGTLDTVVFIDMNHAWRYRGSPEPQEDPDVGADAPMQFAAEVDRTLRVPRLLYRETETEQTFRPTLYHLFGLQAYNDE